MILKHFSSFVVPLFCGTLLTVGCHPPQPACPKAALAHVSTVTPAAEPREIGPQTDEQLRARYAAAVKDAEQADPEEISRKLWPIVPWNTKLRFRPDKVCGARVLVATWTDRSDYDSQVGSEIAASREVWVTAVPQLQDFCATTSVAPGGVKLRLEQLLGLPPGGKKDRFVELWVDPADLFRPAADPEISDAEAGPRFPVSHRFVTVSQAHREWYNALTDRSYKENGYPWTRLGYTYDWGNPQSDEGLSEFVLRKGAQVEVARVVKTADYCVPGKAAAGVKP